MFKVVNKLEVKKVQKELGRWNESLYGFHFKAKHIYNKECCFMQKQPREMENKRSLGIRMEVVEEWGLEVEKSSQRL